MTHLLDGRGLPELGGLHGGGELEVGGEAGGVVGGVLHDLDLAVRRDEAVLAGHVPLLVLGLQPEGAVAGLVAHGVGPVLINLVDL